MGTKKTILLVEDDTFFSSIIQEYLVEEGYSVLCVSTGEAAIQACEATSHIDLVLMDTVLPGIDGIEAARRITDFSPNLPFISISSNDLPESAHELFMLQYKKTYNLSFLDQDFLNTIEIFIN